MKLTIFQKRLRILHIVNCIIAFLIPVTSALGIWLSRQADPERMLFLFPMISLVFGLMAITVGVFLPKKSANATISGRTLRILMLFTLLVNKSTTYISDSQPRQLFRSWDFVGFLIISSFMGMINCLGILVCVTEQMPAAAAANIAACILWLILIPTSGFWTYYNGYITDILENGNSSTPGKRTLRFMGIGALIFFLITGSGFLYAVFKELQRPNKLASFDAEALHQNLAAMNERIDMLTADEILPSDEFENLEAALTDIQQSHNNQKIYYQLQFPQEGTLNLVSWNDTSEDVFIDCFEVLEGERLKRTKSFLSASLSKEDVMGKENGILE